MWTVLCFLLLAQIIRLKEENEHLSDQVKDLLVQVTKLNATVQLEREERKKLQVETKKEISQLQGNFDTILQMFVTVSNQVGIAFDIEEVSYYQEMTCKYKSMIFLSYLNAPL